LALSGFEPIRKYSSNNFYQSISAKSDKGIDPGGGTFSACPFADALVR
jgi:hypothetical protein